jgi:hypothetical protein
MCYSAREEQAFARNFTMMSVSQNIDLYKWLVGQQNTQKEFFILFIYLLQLGLHPVAVVLP